MGDIREFWIACLFIVAGFAISILICVSTSIHNWLGIFQFAFVLVSGLLIGQLLILGFAGIVRLITKNDD